MPDPSRSRSAVEHSSGRRSRRRANSPRLSPAERLWTRVELAGGVFLCAIAMATPWIYGTTEDWAMRLMNILSIAAAAVLLVSAWFGAPAPAQSPPRSAKALRTAFLILNLLLLAFCLVAWANARATFSIPDRSFTYRDKIISWLPTSYDQPRTWNFFVQSLAFFLVFWAARTWISRGWRVRGHHENRDENVPPPAPSNRRLKTLLWLLAINGFVLTVQAVFQRLTGSPKLLWLRDSYWHEANSAFGPYSYRGNAADYLNLIWPLTFGLWSWLAAKKRSHGRILSDGPELLLIPMFLVTAAGTFISLSRGGSLTAAVLLVVLFAILLVRARSRWIRIIVAAGAIAIVALVIGISEGKLLDRFRTITTDNLSGREEIYKNARQMHADYPVFGTGPGTFQSVYHMYRENTGQVWQGFLHDDWYEALVTFGWTGFVLILAQFAVLFTWGFAQRSAWPARPLGYCLALALAGCMLHAKGDFPFETWSVQLTFVLIAAMFVSYASINGEPVTQA